PSVTTSVKPLKTVIVAKVAINGAILPAVINKPLIAPKIAPKIHPSNKAMIESTPDTIKIATIALDNANVEPTDRSIPPVKITNVIPNAINPLIETCLSKLNKLDGSKNALFNILIIITNNINPINGIIFSKYENDSLDCDMYFPSCS